MPDNFGLTQIVTLKDAQDVWESFQGRFFSPEIPTGVEVKFDPDLPQFNPREKKDAKYKHPGFPDKVTGKLPVDPDRTLHSDDFDDFLNGNIIKIPGHIKLTKEGLEQVAEAIKEGKYDDDALKQEAHTFYALWLFKLNRITRQQMTTILARAQIPQEYPLKETFPILDSKGEFTTEAWQIWIPAVAKSTYGEKFTKESLTVFLNQLKLLVQAAPKSEQVFFLSEENPNIVNPTHRELGNALAINRAWHQTEYLGKKYDLHFSFGMIEALQIVQHGVNGAAASRAKLGKVGIDDVREGVEYYYRPTAISMANSGVEATTKGIHGYTESPMPAVTAHDTFHSKLHNTIRPEFHMMLNHMKQVISKQTKQKWSKTMWELVDREFHSFQYKSIKDLTPKKGAEIFVNMLHRDDDDKAFLFKHSGTYAQVVDWDELSDDGFPMVWDMVNHSDVWKKLYKIDIDYLGFPYAPLIEQMRVFQKAVGSEHKHPEILALKYHFFRTTSSNTEFKKICSLLDSLGDNLIVKQGEKTTDKDQKLVFGKYAVGEDKNITILKFKDFGKETLINDKSVKNLLPTLMKMHLAEKFGAKNDGAVQVALGQVSTEFKSIHQKSTFSKDMLKQSIDKLPSAMAKIDFLEACYEQIIHSKGYTRRHATADNLFSFFKNPLTTSQREHIILLKEKLNEIITESQQGLPEEESKQLNWCMKNSSNLFNCNTDRFYLHLDSTVPTAGPKV
ncbi:TPA: hypothetical protein ACTXXA_003028 [Legionella anisa]